MYSWEGSYIRWTCRRSRAVWPTTPLFPRLRFLGVFKVVSAVKNQGQYSRAGVPCFLGGVATVGAVFGWIPRGALSSCTPSTCKYGYSVGVDGGNEVPFLSTVEGLAPSFTRKSSSSRVSVAGGFRSHLARVTDFLSVLVVSIGMFIEVVSAVTSEGHLNPVGRSLPPRRVFFCWYCLLVDTVVSLLADSSCTPPLARAVFCFADGWTVGDYLYLCTEEGLGSFWVSRMPVDWCPLHR